MLKNVKKNPSILCTYFLVKKATKPYFVPSSCATTKHWFFFAVVVYGLFGFFGA
jgi:hypothetical protein